mgnify:CR=1 FL=1
MKILRRLLILVLVLLAALFCVLARAWFNQDRLAFAPASYPDSQQLPDTGAFLAFDNPRLVAWERRIPPTDSSQKITLLFLHGRGFPLDPVAFWLRRFNQAGLNLVVAEYPGFPRTSAQGADRLSLDDTLTDMTEICRHLRASRPEEAIVIVGFSMGGHLGMRLPEDCQDALITFATYLDSSDLMPFGLGRFVKHRFSAEQALAQRKKPMVVFHAPMDSIVPYSEKQRIIDALPFGTLVSHYDLDGVDHNFISHRLTHEVMKALIVLGYDVEPYERP